MLSVSEAFQTAMKLPVKNLRASVSTNEAVPQTFGSGDVLKSIEVEGAGNFFSAATKSLTVKLFGTDYNLVGAGITPAIQAQITTSEGTSTYESMSYGLFIVADQVVDLEKNLTTIKAYDVMGVLALRDYAVSWPCTIKSLAEQIAAKFGINLVTDMTTLANYDYEIAEDLYANINNVTYRDILSEIAGATGTICRINDTTLEFIEPPLSSAVDTLSYANLLKVKFEPQYGPINSVVLSRTPQEDNIAVRDEASITSNGLTELKLANNEILDDDRELLAQPILNVVDGFAYYPIEANTEGHGWYECGDRIDVTDGTNTWGTVVAYYKITCDGGFKENIKGVALAETQTDYSMAGGIKRTIYNTEIKVDKQGREIQSIVEEQIQFADEVQKNFTNITQNISTVVTSVQNSGGDNLIRNSAMFAEDSDGNPAYWMLGSAGTISIMPSADASASGSLSGQVIKLAGKTITQVITVKPDDDNILGEDKTYYSFSCRMKKTAVGTCSVTLSDGTQDGVWSVAIGNGEASNYGEFAIDAMLPHSTELALTVTASSDAEFYITDMMIAVGNYHTQWTQAADEFSNTQVQVDKEGVTVRDSSHNGVYTKQTPQQFEVYSNRSLVARLDNDRVLAENGSFTEGIDMPPLKIVPQPDGWAFVKKS